MMYLHPCAVQTWLGWPGSGLPSWESHRSPRTPQQRHLPDWQPLQRQTHRLRLGNASGTGRGGHVQPGIQTRYTLVWWSGTLIIINNDNEYLLSTNLSHRTRRAVQNWLLHVTSSVYTRQPWSSLQCHFICSHRSHIGFHFVQSVFGTLQLVSTMCRVSVEGYGTFSQRVERPLKATVSHYVQSVCGKLQFVFSMCKASVEGYRSFSVCAECLW